MFLHSLQYSSRYSPLGALDEDIPNTLKPNILPSSTRGSMPSRAPLGWLGRATARRLLPRLCRLAHRAAGAVWSVVAHLETGEVLVREGSAPNPAWIEAFIEGPRHAARSGLGGAESTDVTWVPLPARNLALILGREGTAFRAKERRQAAALARIADAWLGALFRERYLLSRLAHPSNQP